MSESSDAKQRSSTTPTRLSMQTLVEKVPDDFLSRVFLLIVQDEARHTRNKRPQYPWTLASISTRWRKICLENPHLWSYILFSWTPQSYGAKKPKESLHLQRIQLQLHRSGTAPLFVRASEPSNWQSESALWKVVLPHSGRWEELEFGYGEEEEDGFGELVSGEGRNTGFANLRHITFDTDEPECGPYPLPLPGHHGSFTSLRSLTLKYVPDLDELEDFRWGQLTHLALEPYTGLLSSLLETLAQCGNLIDLCLSLDEEYQGMSLAEISKDVKEESVVIPALQSLTLRDSVYSFIYNVLPFIQLPSLSSLSSDFVDVNEKEYDLLLDFVDRSPSITEWGVKFSTKRVDGEAEDEDEDDGVHSEENEFGDDCIATLLCNAPQLQTLILTINNSSLISTLATTLLEKQLDSTRYLCSSLEQLKLYVDHPPEVGLDWAPLVEMVRARHRMKEGDSLKSLYIIYLYPADDADGKSGDAGFKRDKTRLEDALNEHIRDGFELYFVPQLKELSLDRD